MFHSSFFCTIVVQFACGTETRLIPTLLSILMVGDAQSPFIHPAVPSSPGRGGRARGVVSFHDAPYAIIIPADDRVWMGRESSHAWHVLHTLPSLMSQHKSTNLRLKSVFFVMNVTDSSHVVGGNSIGVYWISSYID